MVVRGPLTYADRADMAAMPPLSDKARAWHRWRKIRMIEWWAKIMLMRLVYEDEHRATYRDEKDQHLRKKRGKRDPNPPLGSPTATEVNAQAAHLVEELQLLGASRVTKRLKKLISYASPRTDWVASPRLSPYDDPKFQAAIAYYVAHPGASPPMIAKAADCDPKTVRKWLNSRIWDWELTDAKAFRAIVASGRDETLPE